MRFELVLCLLALSLVFFAHSVQAAPSLDSQRLFEDVEKTLAHAKAPAVVQKPSRNVASQPLSEAEIRDMDAVMDGRIQYEEPSPDETGGPGDQE